MAMVAIFAGIAQAQEDRIEADCRNLLHCSVFNCGCTAEFLENHLGGEQADILLRLWTYGENGGGQHNEMLDLYTRYGSDKISDAVMNFHRHRESHRFRLQCHPWAGCGSYGQRARVSCTNCRRYRRDFVFRLECHHAKVFVLRQLVQNVRGRRDRIAALK